MISDLDISRAAHLMMHQYGGKAELEAAKYADVLLGRGDLEGLLTWTRIARTIVALRLTPTHLPH